MSSPEPPAQLPAESPAELLVVGKLVAAQGLRGELRVLPLTDFPERFTQPGPRWLRGRQGPARSVRLLAGRPLPGKELFVLRLAGVDDRSGAEALVGQELLVDAADRPPLPTGEFHWLDLAGLEVRLLGPGDPAGAPLVGRVSDLIHAGNDLLEVELSEPPGRRVLIPFVEAIVPEVRVDEGWLGITPPPGLLEL
ncbi:MAG: ribosome maturation factor RimM [Cyanobium sp.]